MYLGAASSPTPTEPKGFGAQPIVTVNPLMPPPPNLQGLKPRASWNPSALAFIGDSVWELYVRRHHFFPPARLTHYYDLVKSNENLLDVLEAGPFLTDEERDVVRWGRNAKVTVPKRFVGNGRHMQTYKNATAMECLVGYLYLSDAPRLHQLMLHLGLASETTEQT
ncbi:hypothetical protein WJX72_011989 [[Myrmecia] bisecta]|uniref:RNase III domain-containing protein n=1 Tax=[Myrmecia] bisecta TaxID=41462 RepID=A0AAW1QGU9_9CHLO